MGIFDRFPYSSTHEMNLDFMLGKATEIAEDMQRVTAGMEQVQAGLEAISEKTEQATQAAAQAAASASSIEGSVTAAEEAAEEAQMHNESAQTWANNALTYKADCQRAATEAAASSSSAAQAATAAAASEDTVATYAQAANASAQSAANNNDSAHQYANQASASASNATFHSSNAQTAATNAQTAATNANTSATNASASADRAASLKTDVETLHRMCTTAVDLAAEQAVAAANSAAQAAATKTDVENLVESLPEDFTDLNNTVNQLSDEIAEIVSVSVDDLHFIVGGMSTTGIYQPSQTYRIVTSDKVKFPANIAIRLASASYRFYIIVYKSDGSIDKNIVWNNSGCCVFIPKETAFKLMIARVTEVTTETDNLAEFSSITVVSLQEDYTHNIEKNAVYSGDYSSLLHLTEPVLLGNYSVGQTVDISPANTIGGYHCATLIDGVIAGEKFVINSTDGNTTRPWAFLDADYKLLSMADSAYAVNVELTAPINAQYLLVQVGMSAYLSAKITRLLNLSIVQDGDDSSTDIVKLNNKAALTEKLIETKYCGNNNKTNLSLLHFSDIHGSTNNIARILELKTEYPNYFDDIIHSGDSVSTYFSDSNPFSVVGGSQVLNLIGNHDCWIQGDTWPSPYNATAQQTYEKFIAPFITNWGVVSAGTNLCYYYKDYADYSIRLICLDCMHYNATQETWLSNVLDDAKTNKYSVVIVNHYPPQSGITALDCTFTSYGKSIPAVETPQSGTQIERLPESAYTVVDSFITGGGNFVCWLAGHTHFDYVGTVTDHSNQLVVIVNCGVVDARYGTDKRINGTKTQDCINIIGFDTTNHIIKICRVGISMDWFERSKNLLSIDYSTKTVIANS